MFGPPVARNRVQARAHSVLTTNDNRLAKGEVRGVRCEVRDVGKGMEEGLEEEVEEWSSGGMEEWRNEVKELHFGKTWQVGIRGHNCEDSGCRDNDDDNDSGAGDDGGDVDVDGGDKKMKIRMLMMLMLMNIVMVTRPLLFDI